MLEVMPSKKQTKTNFARIGLFSVVLLMSALVIAVMFLKKSGTETSLDTRKEAMVDSGLVELDTYPFNQSTLKVGETQNINLQINTKDKAVDSVSLVFEVVADEGLLSKDKIQLTGGVPSDLEVTKKEIVDSACSKDCYVVTLTLQGKGGATFATHNQMTTISQLSFTPQKEGSFKIKISQDSTAVESESNTDVLQKPSVLDFQYYVTKNGIDAAQCYFDYSSWSTCENGWQTRSYSVEPENCNWYQSDDLEEISRQCTDSNTVSANSSYFYLYSNDSCLNQSSNGDSLYVIWNNAKYPNVTWIDASKNSSFSSFYHKKVDGNINQTNGDWIMVNATNFTSSDGDGGNLYIQPNTTYYFRLYNSDGKYISSVRYYVTYCSGDQSSYKNCNDACGESSDQSKSCAPGMTCYQGYCRNEDNLTDSMCLPVLGVKSSEQSCNEYCSSNNDCASGLSCYWNRCRNPLSLSNVSCQTSSSTSTTSYSSSTLLPSDAYDLTTYGCNHGCNNNRDCNANMRCYQGSCRLADDPENQNCGSLTSSLNEASSSSKAAAIVTSNSPTPTTTPVSKKGFSLGAFDFNKIIGSFSWQWLAIIGVVVLSILALVILSIGKAKKDPWTNHVQMDKKPEVKAPEIKEIKSQEESFNPPTLEKPSEDTGVKIPEDKPLQL